MIHYCTDTFTASNAIAPYGTVGGLTSLAMGGSFDSGFISSGVTQTASLAGAFDICAGNPLCNATMAGGVGGTASYLSGGSFEDGFRNGMFSRLFNDVAHMGFNFRIPGFLQRYLPDSWGKGFSGGIAISRPDIHGKGEYDIGIYGSADVDGGQVGIGGAKARAGVNYVADTLADFAGGSNVIEAHAILSISVDTDIYNQPEGWSIGIGPGAGVGVFAQETAVYSLRHGKTFK